MFLTIGRPYSPLLHEVSIEEWLFHSRQKARGVLRDGDHEILYIPRGQRAENECYSCKWSFLQVLSGKTFNPRTICASVLRSCP